MLKHQDFVKNNDLDFFFTKNLNADTRLRVLKETAELLDTDPNYLAIDKSLLDAYKASESTRHLTDIYEEFESSLKDRMNFYMS